VKENCEENRAEVKRLYDTLYAIYTEKLLDNNSTSIDLGEMVKALIDLSKQLTQIDDTLIKATSEYTKLFKASSLNKSSNSGNDGFSLEDL